MTRRGRPPRKTSGERRHFSPQNAARWVAFQAIRSWRERSVFVSRVLDELFAKQHLSPADRRLATELASETVRRQLTLDTILAKFVTRPRDEVEPDVWLLLQLGVCQLVCLPQIPAHAAVHETVALCEQLRNPRPKGFINGVLRTIERDLHSSNKQAEITFEDLSPNVLPIVERHDGQIEYRLQRFRRPVFDALQPDPVNGLAQMVSLPPWLLRRWQTQGWNEEQLLRTGLWYTIPGQMSLRVNLNETTREKVLEILAAANCPAEPGDWPESVRLLGGVRVADLPGFEQGWFSVQDESAMSACHLLNPQPSEWILDLCAAPGGKTTHLAEWLRGTGEVIACDIAADRLMTVDENVRRLKLTNVRSVAIGPEGQGVSEGPFDAVLVDVPCSNTGVLGKRPEARWRLDERSIEELVPLQQQLLARAIALTKPGGRVLYSTCSIDTVENEGVVEVVLASHPEVQVREQRSHLPGHPGDGGYQALLAKN